MENALFNDCLELIERFVAKGIPTFSTFCSLWKEMEFQAIYTLQTSNIELINTTEAALHVAKRVICARNLNGDALYTPASDEVHAALTRRMAGLFLMYAIFFKQPTEQFVKISISQRTWQEIQKFLQLVPKVQPAASNEVNYIYWRLVQAQAFRFAAADYASGLENLIKYDSIKHEQKDEGNAFLRQELPGLQAVQKILPPLCKLETHYNEIKRQLVKNATEGLTTQALPATTIFHELQSSFNRIRDIIEAEQSASGNKEKNNESPIADSGEGNEEDRPMSVCRSLTNSIFKDTLPHDVLLDLDDIKEESSDKEQSDNNNEVVTTETKNKLPRGLEMLLADAEDTDNNASVSKRNVRRSARKSACGKSKQKKLEKDSDEESAEDTDL